MLLCLYMLYRCGINAVDEPIIGWRNAQKPLLFGAACVTLTMVAAYAFICVAWTRYNALAVSDLLLIVGLVTSIISIGFTLLPKGRPSSRAVSVTSTCANNGQLLTLASLHLVPVSTFLVVLIAVVLMTNSALAAASHLADLQQPKPVITLSGAVQQKG